MAEIKLAIEGAGSVTATENLFQIPGVIGTWITDENSRKEGVIATIATIVAITAGTLSIAEKLYEWHKKFKAPQAEIKIEKVLLVSPSGKRLLLQDATIEQIKEFLED
jgi:hypothetical protein